MILRRTQDEPFDVRGHSEQCRTMKDNVTIVEGEVVENLPNTLFRVKIFNSEKIILCYLSGKMRKNYIKILPGDKVRLELTPYDLNRGRITFRL
jgi:translation initiation factor IF-1